MLAVTALAATIGARHLDDADVVAPHRTGQHGTVRTGAFDNDNEVGGVEAQRPGDQ